MNIEFTVSPSLVVEFTGDVKYKMPINPDTGHTFISIEEAQLLE